MLLFRPPISKAKIINSVIMRLVSSGAIPQNSFNVSFTPSMYGSGLALTEPHNFEKNRTILAVSAKDSVNYWESRSLANRSFGLEIELHKTSKDEVVNIENRFVRLVL